MFVESKYPKYRTISIIFIFLVLTVPNSWLPELNQYEATNTLVAKDILDNGDYFVTRLLGNPSDIAPLTPWLLSVLFRILPINEFTIRLIGILPLGGMVILCAFTSYRSAGSRAAAAAAVAVMSNYMALSKGVLGEESMLFCLLINASWFVWYILGRVQRQWLYAWFFAHMLVFFSDTDKWFCRNFLFLLPIIISKTSIKNLVKVKASGPYYVRSYFLRICFVLDIYNPLPDRKYDKLFSEI